MVLGLPSAIVLAECQEEICMLQGSPAGVQQPGSEGGDATAGNPHRAQTSPCELFELILLLDLEKQLPVERFEAAVSQSAVPFPPPLTGLPVAAGPAAAWDRAAAGSAAGAAAGATDGATDGSADEVI